MILKKLILIGLLMTTCVLANAQTISNMQIHYDMGSYKVNDREITRNQMRGKFQMLGFDSLGSYYWGADLIYSPEEDKATSGQLTIFRGFKFSKKTHLQLVAGHTGIVGLNNFYYAGIHHPLKFGKVIILPMLLYSYNKSAKGPDVLFTTAFNTRILNDKVTIFGFFNAFTTDKVLPDGTINGKRTVMQLSPNIMYNLTKQIAIGTEIEAAYHRYSPEDKVIVLPGAMMRWTF
ncbi:MAG: DUF5020 family protein [Cyclobacteriaceae bacterium]